MLTYTGIEIDPLNPREDQISALDIAVSLGRINRHAGHTRLPFSDAQHCLLVASRVKKYITSTNWQDKPIKQVELVLKALLHDAAEYLTNDIPSPIKQALKPRICEIEDRIQNTIYKTFNLSPPTKEEKNLIKNEDIAAFNLETSRLKIGIIDLALDSYDRLFERPWSPTLTAVDCQPSVMDSNQATLEWLRALEILLKERDRLNAQLRSSEAKRNRSSSKKGTRTKSSSRTRAKRKRAARSNQS